LIPLRQKMFAIEQAMVSRTNREGNDQRGLTRDGLPVSCPSLRDPEVGNLECHFCFVVHIVGRVMSVSFVTADRFCLRRPERPTVQEVICQARSGSAGFIGSAASAGLRLSEIS